LVAGEFIYVAPSPTTTTTTTTLPPLCTLVPGSFTTEPDCVLVAGEFIYVSNP
jgi:hypothetical protein